MHGGQVNLRCNQAAMLCALNASQLNKHGNVPLEIGDELPKKKLISMPFAIVKIDLVLVLTADVDDLRHDLIAVGLAFCKGAHYQTPISMKSFSKRTSRLKVRHQLAHNVRQVLLCHHARKLEVSN